ncbi:MAG: Uma2 family endonuclease [Desulfobacterales bacterium]|nr:Uma2 family endonuclease [Desulfobacterales bacterium]MBF0398715.1 Uma2 family endonuclease [Desulfobacterales bacterium]
MSPSYNHSLIQANLIAVLKTIKKYSIFSELSININGAEHIPDICLYTKRKPIIRDIKRMEELPLLAIEILSPSQTVEEALNKFNIYFDAGIKSCWLVIAIPHNVMVFSSKDSYKTFFTGDVIDEIIDIKIPISEIFE